MDYNVEYDNIKKQYFYYGCSDKISESNNGIFELNNHTVSLNEDNSYTLLAKGKIYLCINSSVYAFPIELKYILNLEKITDNKKIIVLFEK